MSAITKAMAHKRALRQQWVEDTSKPVAPDPPPGLEAIGSTLFEQLQWINARCVHLGEFAMSPWWMQHMREFFDSRKMIDCTLAGLRAGKSTSILRPLVVNALFTKHNLGKGVGVIPVLSARRQEGADKFRRIVQVLRAAGLSSETEESDKGLPWGLDETFKHRTAQGGDLELSFRNVHGESLVIRCMPVKLGAFVGYDCAGAMVDELDCWEASPEMAASFLEDLLRRTTLSANTAKIFLCSAWYPRLESQRYAKARGTHEEKTRASKSAHRLMVEAGTTDLLHLATLGVAGDALDLRERDRLYQQRPLPGLLRKADPMRPAIPSWVANPRADILACWKNVNQPMRTQEENLSTLLSEFGVDYAAPRIEKKGSRPSYAGLAEMTQAILRRHPEDSAADPRMSEHDILHRTGPCAPGYNPRARGTGGGFLL